MILQFSHSFLTDALTFINSVFSHDDAAFRQVVRRHFERHFVARRQEDELRPHPARHMGQHPVPILQFHPEQGVRQHFHYGAFNFNGVFARQVKISGSASVINTVCSKWADS